MVHNPPHSPHTQVPACKGFYFGFLENGLASGTGQWTFTTTAAPMIEPWGGTACPKLIKDSTRAALAILGAASTASGVGGGGGGGGGGGAGGVLMAAVVATPAVPVVAAILPVVAAVLPVGAAVAMPVAQVMP